MLVAYAFNNFIDVAAWCYSSTLLSWYLIAKLDKLFISNILVLPVCETSWHNPDSINANLVNWFNKCACLVFIISKLIACVHYITVTPWS